MVFKVVVEYWKRDLNPNGKQATFELIIDYINESRKMQRMETPSGGFKSGGLGEVKYHTDGTPFTGRYVLARREGEKDAHLHCKYEANCFLLIFIQLGKTTKVSLSDVATSCERGSEISGTKSILVLNLAMDLHYELPQSSHSATSF